MVIRQQIIDSVVRLGGRVTTGDVVKHTGAPLHVVTNTLNQLIFKAQGRLEVSEKGDVVYAFPPGFKYRLAAVGIFAVAGAVINALLAFGWLAFRTFFGVALIISLLILICVFARILDSIWKLMFKDDEFGGNGYRTNSGYDYGTFKNDGSNFPFFGNCFAFLFSDGDPNHNFEEKRWSTVTEVIRRHRGVVTAEQLAPFIDGRDRDIDRKILPVLIRFNGRPEVTNSGNLVYVFEHLQITSVTAEIRAEVYSAQASKTSTDLYESQWTIGERYNLRLVRKLVWLNLALATVHFAITSHSSVGINSRDIWTALLWNHFLSGLLFTNAVAFVILPFFSCAYVNFKNHFIDKRNERRRAWFATLLHPHHTLKVKLHEARAYSQSERYVHDQEIIYRSDRDLIEQEPTFTESACQSAAATNDAGSTIALPPPSGRRGRYREVMASYLRKPTPNHFEL